MVATLRNSVDKMNDLLARLSQHNKGRSEEPRPIALRALASALAIRSARLEQALGHLLQNAIDASDPGEPVIVLVEQRGIEAAIDVIDQGRGMSVEFVRSRLFKPFASTKDGGFGIGAFEARALIAAMGGRLEVESREGEGSRFSIILPLLADRPAAIIAERMRA
jgi:signal transduction histidine kinase